MTGVAHAVMGSSAENRSTYSITVGTNGSNASGFNSGVYGSVSPGTYRGSTINLLRNTLTRDFQFGITTQSVTATFIDRIQIVDGSGVTRIYRASQGIVGLDNITWGDGASPVYLPAHDGQIRQMIVYWKI